MPCKSLCFLILIISASLLVRAIAIIPVYRQASAKGCNSNDDSSCSDKQDSNSNNDHKRSSSNNYGGDDDGNSAKKDKTPFVLAQPMPLP
jgi:hypothetical protein